MPAETKALRCMLLIRRFEAALAARPDHGFQLLSAGEEAVAVGLSSHLEPTDQLLTGGRSIGPALARGMNPGRVMAELLGKVGGSNRGKGGRGHLADPSAGFFGAHAVVGGNITIATGVALARKLAKDPGVVVVLFGDGACGSGALHESLNIAAAWALPILFLCNNNQLSVSTRRTDVLAPRELSDLGRAFQMPSETIDGMDVTIVAAEVLKALTYVRSGAGPAFLECLSARFASHSTTARETRTLEDLAVIRRQCPIDRERARLISAGLLNFITAEALEQDVDRDVAEALRFAETSPYPDAHEALTDVV